MPLMRDGGRYFSRPSPDATMMLSLPLMILRFSLCCLHADDTPAAMLAEIFFMIFTRLASLMTMPMMTPLLSRCRAFANANSRRR